MKGIPHCMNKDSPESIIIWHKKRSGFLADWSISVKNACWGISRNWSINAMSRHLQHPTEASWRKRAPGLRPSLDWSPLPGPGIPGHPTESVWTSLPSIPPQEERDSVPAALGRKKLSSAPACNQDHSLEMALAKKMHQAGIKPDL